MIKGLIAAFPDSGLRRNDVILFPRAFTAAPLNNPRQIQRVWRLLLIDAAGGKEVMGITRLEVEGFRSLRSQSRFPDDAGVNVVIGPNASGKSNLLRVLEMLSIAASGGLGKWIQKEGGMDPLLWDGQVDQIRLFLQTTSRESSLNATDGALTYELVLSRLGRNSDFRIEYELLADCSRLEPGASHNPFKIIERRMGHEMLVELNGQTHNGSDASIPDDETVLSYLNSPFTRNDRLTSYQKDLSNWKIYQGLQTHQEAYMRSPQVTRAETQVNSDGQNLVSVLHTLYTSSRDFKNEINLAMSAAFGDDFDELVFPPAADQRIQLRIRWKSLKREQSAADLSDGTLRFLFLLTVFANPSPATLIAIDEPETGLHPGMLPIVAEYARDASNRSQVILTTHSPEFLNAFGSEPPTTTVVGRQDGETKLRVVDGDELAYWLKQYTLGELFRTGELESIR